MKFQSQAIKANGQIFVSGQIPADPSGNLVEGSISQKTEACCKNIKAILEAAGSGLDKVIKVNVCVICFWWLFVFIHVLLCTNLFGIGLLNRYGKFW